ncbi:MAG: dehydrogenase [Planctomycetes bacterium]|nr:dehydrogenase [Planctomycetota bacterium]
MVEAAARERLLGLYRRMYLIRRFEERLEKLFAEGMLAGTFHASVGQEAVAVGVAAALKKEDAVISNHRGHGHLIARGAEPWRIAAELFGREEGYCGGRGGTQHLSAPETGFICANGITGGGIPIAAGAGLALKKEGRGRIAAVFFGDGASNQGTFHESLNMASVWSLPVLFVCENNCYAMGTHVECSTSVKRISDRGAAYGIEAASVDGNDVLAVKAAAERAANRVRGGRPYLLECRTYRVHGHSKSDKAPYRREEEYVFWCERCPLKRARAALADMGATEAEVRLVEAEVEQIIDEAAARARASKEPPAEGLEEAVFATPAGKVPGPEAEAGRSSGMSYAEALNLALREAMDGDESVFLMGEDVGVYNGAFKVSKGLLEKYGPGRVIDTPISENSIVGAGVGAALMGLRPVVEIMFMDFMYLAADQAANHAAKMHFMFNGKLRVPLVIRTPAGGYRGYGATHSQTLEGAFMQVAGLKIAAPSNPRDARGMLLAAIEDDDPVLFVEHKLLYGKRGEVPDAKETLPLWGARTVRAGDAVTIASYGYTLHLALAAAEHLAGQGVEAEVIDLRSIYPLDTATVAESAARTGRLVIAEEGVRFGGVGAELAAAVGEEAFGYLEAPILRVGARRVPIPAARRLEDAVLPSAGDIAAACMSALETD